MMYKIKTELSEPFLIRAGIESGGDPERIIPAIASTVSSYKDSEKVLKEISHLLDMISEGKVTSIKITEL